ncbi:MAG: hypothetical protein K2X47_18365 [Bdellovibrionales bacterium]|nr:hypothetical protein [Bdellovibrionales bacterium]
MSIRSLLATSAMLFASTACKPILDSRAPASLPSAPTYDLPTDTTHPPAESGTVGTLTAPPPVGGGNSTLMAKNPWWPLVPGSKWNFQKADNGHPLTIKILPSPATFGCASNPIHVFFEKQHEDAYWGPSINANLHWILGAQANGDLMGYGHYTSDLQGNMGTDTMNYRTNTAGVYPYFLIPGNPKHQQSSTSRHSLPATAGITNSCIADDNNFFSTWNVVWSYSTVETPAYTGPALKVQFDEQSGGRQIEDWYFVHGLGVVRIAVKNPDGSVSVDMRLTSYELIDADVQLSRNPQAPLPPTVVPTSTFAVGKTPNPAASNQVLNVNVGETLYYTWSSSNATSLNSFYSTDGADGCVNGFLATDTKKPWNANSLKGTYQSVVPACMAGHSYQITVRAISSSGHVAPKTVTIKVASVPAQAAPTVSLGLNSAGTLKYLELNPGENATYFYSVQNAARVETYYHATAPDSCSGGWTATDLRKPWVAVPMGTGSISGTAADCQAARAYTLVVVAYSSGDKQVARDQVTIYVRGNVQQQMDAAAVSQPKNQWVWSWWYHNLNGTSVPAIDSFVEVDPAKAVVDVPLNDWWNCTQNLDCAGMAAYYLPASPAPYLNQSSSVAFATAVGPHSYATLKGLQFSNGGNNQVVSSCAGLEKTYDGPDGTGFVGSGQINVRIPSPGIPTTCTFKVVRPDGKAGNTISLTMAAGVMQPPSVSNLGGGC